MNLNFVVYDLTVSEKTSFKDLSDLWLTIKD